MNEPTAPEKNVFIDIHAHVRRGDVPIRFGQTAFCSPEQLIAKYDAMGVERGVLLPGVNPECEFIPQGCMEALEICRSYPGRFIPFCNIDPRSMTNSSDAPLGELLAFYKERGFKGIGEICANLPFLHPMCQNLFRHVETAEMPLTFHIAAHMGGTYGLYDEPGLPQLEYCLRTFPKLQFLGHSTAFWCEMSKLRTPGDRYTYPDYPVTEEGVLPALFRRYPNLYGDLSAGSGYHALARDRQYAARFLDEFQDRLLYGTDICAPTSDAPLARFLLDMRDKRFISDTVLTKIAKSNAIKLLKL